MWQEFSWTEGGYAVARAQRSSNLSLESSGLLQKEPMFCFEVSLRYVQIQLKVGGLAAASDQLRDAPTDMQPMARCRKGAEQCCKRAQTALKLMYWTRLMYEYNEVCCLAP